MTTGYYLDADANGNLGFFLASNNTELMYLSDVGDLSVSGSISGSSYNLVGGTGISFSGTTITNTGVTSLQGDTGALSLTANNGISISGLGIGINFAGDYVWSGIQQFSNIEAIELLSQNGILYLNSGDGDSTYSNAQITFNYQAGGDTPYYSHWIHTRHNGGGLVGNAIDFYTCNSTQNGVFPTDGVLGLTIDSGDGVTVYKSLSVSGQGNFGGSLGLTSSEIGFFPYSSGAVLGNNISPITFWGNTDSVAGFIGENYNSIQIGMFNRTSTASGSIAANSWMMNLGINSSGEVYTFVPTNYAIGVASSENSSIRNILDDGSGNMTVAGKISGGSYNLSGGAGISFSGTTITNTGVTSITAGTNITISGSTGDVTINASGGGSSYTAGNGISISSSTIAMSGVMTVTGPAGFKVEGDANDPTIEVYDTANSSYTIEIGQASSAGAYFTNANVGDSIIRGNYERLLLGVTAEDAGLILTNGYVVTTKNNTLDSGSGGLTIAGTAIGGFAQFFNSGTLRPTSLPFTYSVTVPAGTWAGYVSVGMFLLPNNSVYSYELSVNLSGSAFVSGTVTGSSPLTDLNGGSGSNYPLTNFPSLPITLKSSGGTITFSVNNSNSTNGMTSILNGNSDSAFQVSVFLVSTSTAS